MTIKTFSAAPLPFQGQKRFFIKDLIGLLQDWQHQGIIRPDTVFLDVFGGSGLLSHHIKQAFPGHTVIWNDYDNYAQRLEHIQDTARLREQIRAITGRGRDRRISATDRQAIIALLWMRDNRGLFTDYLSVSSWLLHQGCYAKDFEHLICHQFYNSVSARPLTAAGYLDGVQRERQNFRTFLRRWQSENSLLILDPPYLQTQTEVAYSVCWRLGDFLALMNAIRPPFVLFGSERSSILDFFEHHKASDERFSGYGLMFRTLSMVKQENRDYLIYQAGTKAKAPDDRRLPE